LRGPDYTEENGEDKMETRRRSPGRVLGPYFFCTARSRCASSLT
jgi:hypothetical protein